MTVHRSLAAASVLRLTGRRPGTRSTAATQIVGRLQDSHGAGPFQDHRWHVIPLPAICGLTTGPMPDGHRDVETALDLLDHRL